MNKRTVNIVENFVVFVIFLVLIQTFLEDLAEFLVWSWDVRQILILTSFGSDLFFTIEFLVRLYNGLTSGKAKEYFFKKRGWLDGS